MHAHTVHILQLIPILALVACGKQEPIVVDTILASYFDRFVRDVGASVQGISGSFGTITLPAVAYCTISTDGRSITVDRTFWNKSSENQREELIYHELGHCALNRDHDSSMQQNSFCPYTIMYPYSFGDSECYANEKPYYFHELARR
jgi:hypothetical protein